MTVRFPKLRLLGLSGADEAALAAEASAIAARIPGFAKRLESERKMSPTKASEYVERCVAGLLDAAGSQYHGRLGPFLSRIVETRQAIEEIYVGIMQHLKETPSLRLEELPPELRLGRLEQLLEQLDQDLAAVQGRSPAAELAGMQKIPVDAKQIVADAELPLPQAAPQSRIPPRALSTAAERLGQLSDQVLDGLEALHGTSLGEDGIATVLASADRLKVRRLLTTLGRLSHEQVELLASGGYLPELARRPRVVQMLESPGAMGKLVEHLGPRGTAAKQGLGPNEVIKLIDEVLERRPGTTPQSAVAEVERAAAAPEVIEPSDVVPSKLRPAWEPHPVEEGLPPSELPRPPQEVLVGTAHDVERALIGGRELGEAELSKVDLPLEEPAAQEWRASVWEQQKAERLQARERMAPEDLVLREQVRLDAAQFAARHGFAGKGWRWWIERTPRFGAFEAQLKALSELDEAFSARGYGLVLRSPRNVIHKPDGVVLTPRGEGFMLAEFKEPLGPQSESFYNSEAGRQKLFEDMNERALMSTELPGCRGWVYDTGAAWLDDVILAIREERLGADLGKRIVIPRAKGLEP